MNFSLERPDWWMMESRVPLLMALWRGTVSLCSPSVRYMWLPLWWTTLNPALPRAFTTLRQDGEGSRSDSYLHQLALESELAELLGEGLQVPLNGLLDVP